MENKQKIISVLKQKFMEIRRGLLILAAVVMGSAPLIVINATASAAQITNRSVTISSGQAAQTGVTYTFTFQPAASPATTIQSMFFQSCTTAISTCTAPAGINLSGGTPSTPGAGSGWQGTVTGFSKDTTTSSPACNVTSNLCIKWTDATNQTSGSNHTITLTGAVNQNATNCSGAANCTFFIRITTYSDGAYATPVDSGTVASSTTQLLTINATIQETLSFCVGATTIDDVTINTPPICTGITGTSLSLGTLDSSHVNISPVGSGANGDSNNGIAELSTNAVNGSTVAYDAIQQSGTNHQGTLRVSGASCNSGASNVDQCIDAVGGTRAHITAGAENFGMTIAGVNCKGTTAYTCAYGSGTNNLKQAANYIGGANSTTYDAESNQILNTATTGWYAWDETGSTVTIASSTAPNGVVDREALILKFAATPNITTPTGAYTAKADFVATPTY